MTRFRFATARQKPYAEVRRFRKGSRKRCGNVPASLWPNVSAWGGLMKDPHPHADSGHTPPRRCGERAPEPEKTDATKGTRMPVSWEEFVGEVGHVPDLAGARCRGRRELFDATISSERGGTTDAAEYAREAAQRLCEQCPALDRCRQWLHSLPPRQRPLGVVAGQVNQPARQHSEVTSDG